MDNQPKPIRSFKDFVVYQSSYEAMLVVMKQIIPKLPESEKYDLSSQLGRACEAIPRLIAEGYAKKHQKAGFRKYLDDSMGESNEIIVCLEQARDLYDVNTDLTNELVDTYDKIGRQLYKPGQSWTNFKRNS